MSDFITNGELRIEAERLCDENDQLRELVRKAHACKTDEGCCEDCYQDEGCCPIERDMHKLGIGVAE